MLTPTDIQNIIKAEKEIFYTKPELDEKFKEQRESFASLQTSVDGLAAKFQKYYDEQQIYVHKVKHIEDWIKQAAAKVGVEYNP